MRNILSRNGAGTIFLEGLECKTKLLLFTLVASEGPLKVQNRGEEACSKLYFGKIIQTAGSKVENGLEHTPKWKDLLQHCFNCLDLEEMY